MKSHSNVLLVGLEIQNRAEQDQMWQKLRLPILSDASMLPAWSIQFWMHMHDNFPKWKNW